jgi:hypothetical protein
MIGDKRYTEALDVSGFARVVEERSSALKPDGDEGGVLEVRMQT